MGLFSNKSSNATAVATPPAAGAPAAPPAASGGSKDKTPIVSPPAPIAAPARASAPLIPTPQLSERQIYLGQLKVRIHQTLVTRLDVQNIRSLPPETVRAEVRSLVRDLCQSEKGLLSNSGHDQDKLMEDVMDETFGLGPIEDAAEGSSIADTS